MDGYNESLLDKMKCKNKVAATKSLHNNMLENIHLGLDIKLEPSDNEDACENKKFCSENVQFIKVEPKILHSNKLQNNHLGVDIKLEPCDNDNGIKTESTEFHYINKEQEDDEYKQQTSVIDHEKYLENVSEIEETKLKAEQQSNPFIVPECVYSLTGVQENDTTIKTDLLVQTDILIDGKILRNKY